MKFEFEIRIPAINKVGTDDIDLREFSNSFSSGQVYPTVDILEKNESDLRYSKTTFHLTQGKCVEGDLLISTEDEFVVISVNGDFNLNPRAEYKTAVDSPDTMWAYGGLIVGKGVTNSGQECLIVPKRESEEVSGLKREEWSYMNKRLNKEKHEVIFHIGR